MIGAEFIERSPVNYRKIRPLLVKCRTKDLYSIVDLWCVFPNQRASFFILTKRESIQLPYPFVSIGEFRTTSPPELLFYDWSRVYQPAPPYNYRKTRHSLVKIRGVLVKLRAIRSTRLTSNYESTM
jgi:hypothetical protein